MIPIRRLDLKRSDLQNTIRIPSCLIIHSGDRLIITYLEDDRSLCNCLQLPEILSTSRTKHCKRRYLQAILTEGSRILADVVQVFRERNN